MTLLPLPRAGPSPPSPPPSSAGAVVAARRRRRPPRRPVAPHGRPAARPTCPRSARTPLSGTVVATSRLGLPELPGGDGAAPARWRWPAAATPCASGPTGPSRSRVALLGHARRVRRRPERPRRCGPTAAARTRRSTGSLPGRARAGAAPARHRLPPTPAEAADAALAALDPTTAVTRRRSGPRSPGARLPAGPHARRTPTRSSAACAIAVDAATSAPAAGAGAAPPARRCRRWRSASPTSTFATPDASVVRLPRRPPGAEVVREGRARRCPQRPTARWPARPTRPAAPAPTVARHRLVDRRSVLGGVTVARRPAGRCSRQRHDRACPRAGCSPPPWSRRCSPTTAACSSAR